VNGGNVSASLNVNMDHHISSPVSEKRQDEEMTNPGEEDCLRDEALPFETLKKAICDLESEIPWDCMKSHWKIDHAGWLEKVKKSSSIQVWKGNIISQIEIKVMGSHNFDNSCRILAKCLMNFVKLYYWIKLGVCLMKHGLKNWRLPQYQEEKMGSTLFG
jgi:hypothetical protein